MGILSNLKKKFKDLFIKTTLSISNNKYKITIGGVMTLSVLMILLGYLNMYGITITTSGNITCGKYCTSYFNISITNYSLCFASNFKLYFDDASKLDSYTLLENGHPINLAGKCLNIGTHQFQLNGIKKMPTDTVKWGINYGNVNIDPLWLGTENYTDYTYNTNTTCIGKVCTVAIGGSYALDVDGQWKTIDQAKSLKNSSVQCNVNSDGKDLATCLDWNTTFITVNLTTTNSLSIAPIPVKVWIPNYTNSSDYHKGALLSNTNVSVTKASSSIQTLPFGLDYVLEYGADSTTITLNESNGGNVGDGSVYGYTSYVNYNFGKCTGMYIDMGGTYNRRIFILWNMTVVPAGSTITNANMSLFMRTAPTSSRTYNALNTSQMNTTGTTYWNEGTLGSSDAIGGSCGSGANCNLDHNRKSVV